MSRSAGTLSSKGPRQAAIAGPRPPVWRVIAIAVVLMLVLILSPATMLVLSVGMLPTVVAFIIDRAPKRYATTTVGALNFAGVFPFLFRLWLYGNDLYAATAVLTDPPSLVAMYLAAAVGWGLYTGAPPAMAAIRRISAANTVRKLEARQKQLTEEWGSEVAQAANS